MPIREYDPLLEQQLQDAELAAAYLSTALEEGRPELFLIALRNVAEARGGMTSLSEAADLNRQSMYRALSDGGNPTLSSLVRLLEALGLRLSVRTASDAATRIELA